MNDLQLTDPTRGNKAATKLAVVDEDEGQGPGAERTALNAKLPDAALTLTDTEREERLRLGADTVLLDTLDGETRSTRGFVKCVLRVPVGHPGATTYGVFVEVDKAGYAALQRAFKTKAPVKVWGRLANRLPLLEDAFDSPVQIVEDGSSLRARVTDAEHPLLLTGPEIGPA